MLQSVAFALVVGAVLEQ
jgi:hypothetical protein